MKKTTIITDHALLRYLERIIGIDVEEYRQDFEETLNTPRLQQTIDFVDKSECKINVKGTICCFRGGKITTCYPG